VVPGFSRRRQRDAAPRLTDHGSRVPGFHGSKASCCCGARVLEAQKSRCRAQAHGSRFQGSGVPGFQGVVLLWCQGSRGADNARCRAQAYGSISQIAKVSEVEVINPYNHGRTTPWNLGTLGNLCTQAPRFQGSGVPGFQGVVLQRCQGLGSAVPGFRGSKVPRRRSAVVPGFSRRKKRDAVRRLTDQILITRDPPVASSGPVLRIQVRPGGCSVVEHGWMERLPRNRCMAIRA
jgi:hypothetical protein